MSDLFQRDALEQVVMPLSMRNGLLEYSASHRDTEVCGLIGGIGELAVNFYETENSAADPRSAYLMDPQGQIDAMRAMRARGEQMLGIFHSHPMSPPEPSPTDLALAAYPGVAYLIASLDPLVDEPLRAYLYDGKAFSAIPLVLVDPPADHQ